MALDLVPKCHHAEHQESEDEYTYTYTYEDEEEDEEAALQEKPATPDTLVQVMLIQHC